MNASFSICIEKYSGIPVGFGHFGYDILLSARAC